MDGFLFFLNQLHYYPACRQAGISCSCACPDEYRGRNTLHRPVRYSAFANSFINFSNSYIQHAGPETLNSQPVIVCVRRSARRQTQHYITPNQ